MNTPKPYPEIAVFVVLLVVGFMLFIFLTWSNSNGMEKYCNENPSYCVPAEYPGKVVQK